MMLYRWCLLAWTAAQAAVMGTRLVPRLTVALATWFKVVISAGLLCHLGTAVGQSAVPFDVNLACDVDRVGVVGGAGLLLARESMCVRAVPVGSLALCAIAMCLYLRTRRFRGREIPPWTAAMHGLCQLCGTCVMARQVARCA